MKVYGSRKGKSRKDQQPGAGRGGGLNLNSLLVVCGGGVDMQGPGD